MIKIVVNCKFLLLITFENIARNIRTYMMASYNMSMFKSDDKEHDECINKLLNSQTNV